jgi:hypothetical protein
MRNHAIFKRADIVPSSGNLVGKCTDGKAQNSGPCLVAAVLSTHLNTQIEKGW